MFIKKRMITNTKLKKILMILLFLTIIFSMVFVENIFAEDFEIKENNVYNISGCMAFANPGVYYLNQSITNYSGSTNCFDTDVNNVILDCQGHSIHKHLGGGSGFIVGFNNHNISVKNCVFENFDYSIYVRGTNNTFINNTILNANQGFMFGPASNIKLINNSVYNIEDIAYQTSCSDTILAENNYLDGYEFLFLKNVSEERIEHGRYGKIMFCNVNDSIVNNVTMINGDSLTLYDSHNNTFLKLNFSENYLELDYSFGGIFLKDSENNLITNSSFISNRDTGIHINSNYNNITNSYFSLNEGNGGIQLNGNYNNIINCSFYQDYLRFLGNEVNHNKILNNEFDNALTVAIFIQNSVNYNLIINNTIKNSLGPGIAIWGNGNSNIFTENKFISNQEAFNFIVDIENNSIYNNFFYGKPFNTALEYVSINYWNNSIGGNYYTNLAGTGHSEICNSTFVEGICDEPYDLFHLTTCEPEVNCSNNTDYRPLKIHELSEEFVYPLIEIITPTENLFLKQYESFWVELNVSCQEGRNCSDMEVYLDPIVPGCDVEYEICTDICGGIYKDNPTSNWVYDNNFMSSGHSACDFNSEYLILNSSFCDENSVSGENGDCAEYTESPGNGYICPSYERLNTNVDLSDCLEIGDTSEFTKTMDEVFNFSSDFFSIQTSLRCIASEKLCTLECSDIFENSSDNWQDDDGLGFDSCINDDEGDIQYLIVEDFVCDDLFGESDGECAGYTEDAGSNYYVCPSYDRVGYAVSSNDCICPGNCNHFILSENETFNFDSIFFSGKEFAISKGGLISTIIGDVPFYTNSSSNPVTINLNEGESEIVKFWVNATAEPSGPYRFFAYVIDVNSLDIDLRTNTDNWFVTIEDEEPQCKEINQPGIYYVTKDVINYSDGNCFDIIIDNVTLDCQGHTINGVGDNYGVLVDFNDNITIINCTFTEWKNGIRFLGVENSVVDYSSFAFNSEDGMYMEWSNYNNITNSDFSNNLISDGEGGLYLIMSNYNNVINCSASGNNIRDGCSGFRIHRGSSNNLFLNNIAENNTGCIGLGFDVGLPIISPNNLVINCTSTGNSLGFGIFGSEGNKTGASNNNIFDGCISKNNGQGFYFSAENVTLINSLSFGDGLSLYLGNSNINVTNNLFISSANLINICSSNCTNNTIYNNYFNGEINLLEEIAYNSWNNSIYGNYYANLVGTGYSEICNSTFVEGICDDPYDLVTKTICTPNDDCSDNTDYLPLSYHEFKHEFLYPKVQLIQPIDSFNISQYESFWVELNVTCLEGKNCGDIDVYLDPVEGCNVDFEDCSMVCGNAFNDFTEDWFYNSNYRGFGLDLCQDSSDEYLILSSYSCDFIESIMGNSIGTDKGDCIMILTEEYVSDICPSYLRNGGVEVTSEDCYCDLTGDCSGFDFGSDIFTTSSIESKGGLVDTTIGAEPFYTNSSSNPVTINLNEGESKIVKFWVNATAEPSGPYRFFAYVIDVNSLDIDLRTNTDNWYVLISERKNETDEEIDDFLRISSSGCTYFWECTDWRPIFCPPNETQTRECVNKGTCRGTMGMPETERNCTYFPLTAVVTEFDEIIEEIIEKEKEVIEEAIIEIKLERRNIFIRIIEFIKDRHKIFYERIRSVVSNWIIFW